MKKRPWLRTPALLLLMVLTLTSGCSNPMNAVEKTSYYFNTIIRLTGYGKNADEILEEGLLLCSHYERLLSVTAENSDIWNINHAKGAPVTVDPETAALLSKALEYATLTDGKIDPTITPLSRIWNFTGDPPGPVPDSEQIAAILPHVDYHLVHVEGNTVWLEDPDAEVDLGFIAKGFIADRLKELFVERGLNSALINLGGNVLAVGEKPDGSAFRTGIQKPFENEGTPLTVIPLRDQSLVTSGSYERCFTQDGILYHHILDPATGYPADTDLDSVTILSDSSLEGDALSTSCFLLGAKKGQELIESLPGIEALFITKDGSVFQTDGFPE